MNEKRNLWLPIALMVAFAATRWPGLLPPNFSAAYGLIFCAGVYLPGRYWWVPLLTMALSDLALNAHYASKYGSSLFPPSLAFNYVAYAGILFLGRKFPVSSSLGRLVGGGILGAVLFYLITNTAAWLFNPFKNPEYTQDLLGWFTALTKGTGGYPAAWEFFRNSLLSGGLFAGLFAGAMKWSASSEESPLEKELPAPAEPAAEDAAPEEAKA